MPVDFQREFYSAEALEQAEHGYACIMQAAAALAAMFNEPAAHQQISTLGRASSVCATLCPALAPEVWLLWTCFSPAVSLSACVNPNFVT
jgi:hypothetical protein